MNRIRNERSKNAFTGHNGYRLILAMWYTPVIVSAIVLIFFKVFINIQKPPLCSG